MTQFQNPWSKASQKVSARNEKQSSSSESSYEQKKGPDPSRIMVSAQAWERFRVAPSSWGRASSGVILLADEVAVPAMGLAEKPGNTPLSPHLYALAPHVVYGLTAGAGRHCERIPSAGDLSRSASRA